MTSAPGHGPAALDVAYEVAERLRHPGHVARTARAAFAAVPEALLLPGWQPASVLLGHAGISMLHARRARDDVRWAQVAHAHLAAAAEATREAGPVAAGDLVLPARLLAAQLGGYDRLLARATEIHAEAAARRVARLADRRAEPGRGLSYLDYDVIAGLAGQGRTLLLSAGHGDERSAHALTDVLTYLIRMTEPVRVAGTRVPGWWCDPEQYVVPRDRETFPRGDFNLGVAHGICGPLALLCLARLAGHDVPGLTDAIRRVTDWLCVRGRTVDGGGATWPGRVAYEDEIAHIADADQAETPGARNDAPGAGGGASRERAGWCYGTVGVAWALYLAGRALADHALTGRATAAISAVLRAPLDHSVGDDPGFCHGRAGVLQAGVRMAAATGDARLWTGVDAAAEGVLAVYDEQTLFGFRQRVRTQKWAGGIDSPALIDGAAGAALALASYADARSGQPVGDHIWDAVFLMS
ncbi:lanthionine synthetase LanC family protein [Streptomyces sp. NPDC007983]|uniref:lanthionine synthetase LanC family protein n=1 Tax=Streptomyces sp. NPDC007983 TaxID=3364800 RepID=UPI0036ECEE78